MRARRLLEAGLDDHGTDAGGIPLLVGERRHLAHEAGRTLNLSRLERGQASQDSWTVPFRLALVESDGVEAAAGMGAAEATVAPITRTPAPSSAAATRAALLHDLWLIRIPSPTSRTGTLR